MNKVVLISIIVILLIVVAGLAYYFYTQQGGTKPAQAKVVELPTGEKIEVPPDISGKVVLYTSIPNVILDPWKSNWTKYFGDLIELEAWRSGTGKVVAKVIAEKKAGEVHADVIYIASLFAFQELVDEGIIDKFPDIPELQYIPDQYKDPNGYYVCGRLLVMVIVYNPDLVQNPPKSWEDLLKPEWKDKVVMANPMYSGSTQFTVAALVSKFGWDYFEKLKENNVLIVKDVPDVARVVASGERPVGITLTMYLKAYPNLKFVIPEEGAIVIPSPMGIVKNAKHPEDAKVLLRFLLSKQASKSLTDAYTYSSRVDAPPPPGFPKLSELKTLKVTISELKPIVDQIRDKWTEIFGG